MKCHPFRATVELLTSLSLWMASDITGNLSLVLVHLSCRESGQLQGPMFLLSPITFVLYYKSVLVSFFKIR